MKKLSFCITCKNRLHQISQTLKQNLDDNRNMSEFIEFVLVDFDSTDGLREWVLANFREEIDHGYLNFFSTKVLQYFHASIAKNTAHFLANGEIVVNLDCDNFTGVNGGMYIVDQFNIYGPNIILHQASVDPSDGSYGRISVLKKYFFVIGGYNEAFHPMAYQDKDLIHRLVELGLSYIVKNDSRYNNALPNSKEESIRYTNSDKPYISMVQENRHLSLKNIRLGNIVANGGYFGIRQDLHKLY